MKSFTPSAWRVNTHSDAAKSIRRRVLTYLQRLLVVLLLPAGFQAQAQLISWELNGQPGNQVSNNSTSNATGVGVGLLSRGAGLTPAAAAGSISSSGWYAAAGQATPIDSAIANNDFYEFTVPLQSGYSANITSVFVNLQASNTGPGFLTLRSSVNNFATNLDTTSISASGTQPRTLTFNLTGVTGTVTFRLYGHGNAAGTSPGTAGTLRIGSATGDDLAVFGTLIAPACPLAITGISVTPESCPGAGDGGLAVTTTGGAGSLFFVVNGPESDSNSVGVFTGLQAGGYIIQVRDSLLCFDIDSAIVSSGQPSASISCPQNVQTGVDGPSSCSWTSPAGGLPLNILSSCGPVDVSWEARFPSQATSITIAAWNFENAAKRVPPNLPYTADAGTAANLNIAPISLAGGPAFSAWNNGTGGGGTFAANSSTWSGAGDKYWQVVVNTVGYGNLKLSSLQQSSNTGPRDFRIEYSFDGVNWVAVAGSDFTTVPATTFSGIVSNLALPPACNNRAALYLRWLRTSETAAGGGTIAAAGTNRIDDVAVAGQPLGAADAAGTGAVGGLVFPLGVSTVTYTASTTGGAPLASCSFAVSVIDNVPPVIACSNQTITFNGQNSIALNVNALAGASDNCALQSLTISPNAIACDQVGQVVPITATARDSSGNTSTCTSLVTVGGLPCGWSQTPSGVNCTGGNSVAFNASANLWTVSSTNCYYDTPYTSDSHAYAQRTLCGDGTITAQVTSITPQGWAGVVMRESNAAGARKIQLMTNLTNFSRREIRTTIGGQAFPQPLLTYNRYWLRIARTGNQFTMYVSANGQVWFFAGTQPIQMGQCIQMGLVVTNYTSNSTVTATFANVSVSGSTTPPPSPGGSPDVLSELEHPMGFSVFPNPASGEATLDLAQYTGKPVRIEMYNMQGQLLYFREVEELQTATERLDISAYKAGMYIVKVRSEGLPEVARRVIVAGN